MQDFEILENPNYLHLYQTEYKRRPYEMYRLTLKLSTILAVLTGITALVIAIAQEEFGMFFAGVLVGIVIYGLGCLVALMIYRSLSIRMSQAVVVADTLLALAADK